MNHHVPCAYVPLGGVVVAVTHNVGLNHWAKLGAEELAQPLHRCLI